MVVLECTATSSLPSSAGNNPGPKTQSQGTVYGAAFFDTAAVGAIPAMGDFLAQTEKKGHDKSIFPTLHKEGSFPLKLLAVP